MDTQIFDKVEDSKNPESEKIPLENVPDLSTVNANDEPVENELSEAETEKKNRKKRSKKKDGPSGFVTGLFDWVSAFLFALVIVVLVMTFCFRLVNVDGSSMMNTLQDEDKVIVTGLNYEPQVGDIVVISHGAELDKALVKRVIAVGGQTVDIDFKTGEVTVDGVLIDEPYILGSTNVSADVEFPIEVTDGTVFVLGDNRPISKDSRYSDVGLIDVENIIGKVQLRVYPFNSFGFVE